MPLDDTLDHAAVDGLTAAVVADWSTAVDAAMVERLGALEPMPVRARIRTAVMTRFQLLEPRKALARRAALFLALPQHLPLGVRLTAHTADAIWQAAGDTATDFNWYSKRAILGAVYAASEIAWFGDDTPDARATLHFVEARLDNVLYYERLKRRWRGAPQ